MQDLLYFNKLAELHSYTKVAAYYQVSQPTISLAVQRLENELHIELVQRNQAHHQIEITPAGKQLAQHAQIISNEVTAIEQSLVPQKQQPINFGLPPIIGNYYFPSLAAQLGETGILDDLSNLEAGSKKLLHQLIDGTVDIALLGSAAPFHNQNLTTTVLTQNQFKIITAKEHPLAQHPTVRMRDLDQADFIGFNDDFIHAETFQKLCRLHGVRVNTRYRTQDVELIKQLVAQNVGISFLTETAITPKDQVQTLNIADDDVPNFFVSLARRTKHPLSEEEQRLMQVLQTAIKAK
ncbi:LysR family transcriptional regulator [Fructilactobacillus florum]|uniref:LysR family transcriptional regulator n=1 Tax=Fructilactobacillus florum TaxID=640331 RepID=UPI001CDA660F|nr:LysR family transcriptional regulator [Fructilactobacillus florum]